MLKRSLLIGSLLCSPVLGMAQNAVVTGQVREPGGKTVANVRMYLATTANAETGRMVQTDDEGRFRFDKVMAGSYRVVAGAVVAEIAEASAGSPQVVVLGRALLLNPSTLARQTGTYFPSTGDLQRASILALDSETVQQNIDIVLASGPLPSNVRFHELREKVVVEGGGAPAFQSGEFGLFFSDGVANQSTALTFRNGAQKSTTPSTSLEVLSGPIVINEVVQMPAFPDDTFRTILPEGIYRVIQPASAPKPSSHSGAGNYYLKGL
jgi:Carboxypeptidase regulatory-like domain